MGADQNFDWGAAAASTLEWWHDAGVDMLVDDVPRDWLAAPEPVAATHVPAASPAPLATAAMPETFAEFVAWRAGADVPEAGWHGTAIAASGPADATVMVLVDCPERDDGDVLMGGSAGRLFDRMLAAIGLSRETVHVAAICAKRPTAGRIGSDVETRLSEIAQHHVGLVGPKRLLVMGNAASRAILATELSNARGRLHRFNHKTAEIGVVASFHPRFLLEKPAAKAEAWKDLQMLIGLGE